MWSEQRARLGYAVFVGLLLITLYRAGAGEIWLFSSPPPVINLSINYSYWVFAGTGLLSLTATKAFYVMFLASVPIVVVAHRWREAVWVFSALLGSYIVTFNILAGHHYHTMVGAFALTIPFWFKSTKMFNLAFKGVRYYACFIFASAALWKIWRGSVFYHGHFANTIQADHASFLHQESGITKAIMELIIQYPSIGDVLFGVVTLIQLSFIVGFFTYKFDKWLLMLLVVFVLGNYVVFNLGSWELLILGICFVPWLAPRPPKGGVQGMPASSTAV